MNARLFRACVILAAASLAAAALLHVVNLRERAVAHEAFIRGADLLEAGDYNRAVDVLGEAYRMDVGNSEILRVFKEAQAVQARETVKKAHLQHGHEGPNGELRPDQVER